ncbi:MAG: cytochrome c maturation protein CcmE [Coriobacteriia bacterium]|nr:cytochrome c maturation protein CcmE [Coriobacteriia bacterium]
MNTQLKKRLTVVTGICVVVLIIVLAVVSGASGYKTMSVAQALEPDNRDARVQVSGQVVSGSYAFDSGTLTFSIFDPEGNPKEHLEVIYQGGVSSTFGNQVTAICTGIINNQGILECSELVTKCPSKYESATDALTVPQLLSYGSTVVDNPLRITGEVKPGSIRSVQEKERLVLQDQASDAEISIVFAGALPDEIKDNSVLVITGSLNSAGQFDATDIALRE